MSLPKVGTGSTRAEAIAFYATYLAKLSGTYQGSYTQYKGMTWAAMYEEVANSNPSVDPYQLGEAVFSAWTDQTLGKDIKAEDAALGKFLSAGEKAVATTNFAGVSISNPLDFLGEIGDFFARLTEASTWIRIGKVIIGGALLLIGLAHMTGAENAAFNAARKVPVAI